MRLVFAALPVALAVAGCSSESETAATPSATISLEYSTKMAPEEAQAKAEKQCAVYSRHAVARAPAEGANPAALVPAVQIYDCVAGKEKEKDTAAGAP
jgi:uncharacterized protein YceK